ncbi:MAG: DUF2062 domain-containing protein [Burkholderiaceae bacterium]
MPQWIARRLPDREEIERSRWLRWLGPRLTHPRLWHVNRRGIALGLAIGVFFGLLAPVAQIPLSVVAGVWLRANLPAAITSTLVTNPLTFAPIYYLAYQVGAFLLGHEVTVEVPQVVADRGVDVIAPVAQSGIVAWVAVWFDKVLAAGKPLVLGLVIFAVVGSVLGYFIVALSWRLRTSLQWRRRRQQRRWSRPAVGTVRKPVTGVDAGSTHSGN